MAFQGLIKERIKLSKQEFLFLTIIIIAALLLRLWDLGAVGFNNDEAIYSGQAATLAGYKEFEGHFSIYRAHPLLLQFMISILFHNFGPNDTVARIIPAILGVLTIILVYMIGKSFYDRKVGMVSALVVTILPYHIMLSREVLLDISLSFFYTLTLYFMVLHSKRPKDVHWLFLVGASAGLCFLSKEVGIFALITSIVSLFLIKTLSIKNILVVISSFLLATSPYWIPILTIPEARDAALSYWHWQTGRDPNQSGDFYLEIISQEALGYVLAALFLVSIVYSFITRNIKRPSVFIPLIWIAIPLMLFQSLAVKGYAFVLPLIPPFALLGISFLLSDWIKKIKIPIHSIIVIALIPLIFVFSGPMLHYLFQIPPLHLVGSAQEPYSREGAIWIKDNIHKGVFLTIDTRTANVIKYYANKDAFSLHSNNNPAYIQINNPDISILSGNIDYLVYEAYVVEQLPFLKEEAKELYELVIKYNGMPIHTVYEHYMDNGKNLIKPALIIYSLNKSKES